MKKIISKAEWLLELGGKKGHRISCYIGDFPCFKPFKNQSVSL